MVPTSGSLSGICIQRYLHIEGPYAAGTEEASATRLQRPAFIFALHTVEVAALDADGRVGLAALLAEAARAGQIERGALAHFRPTGRGSEVYCTVDLASPEDFNPTSPVHLGALERTGRRLAHSLTAFLRAHHPAFARAEIAAFPTRVGIRESRRVRGESTITAAAVLRGLETLDRVALGAWPMELREKATGPRWRYPENDRPTQIPLGALKVANVSNLWTAGPNGRKKRRESVSPAANPPHAARSKVLVDRSEPDALVQELGGRYAEETSMYLGAR